MNGAQPIRRQLTGAAAISAALDAGETPRLVLAAQPPHAPETAALLARIKAADIPIHFASANSLRRLSLCNPPAEVLALCGAPVRAELQQALCGDGLFWLLVGVEFPGNLGNAMRLAEVSGAAGIAVDSNFVRKGRHEALRASMRADRFLPVFWRRADCVIAAARAAGRRVVAVENTGATAPWQADLTAPLLLVLGGEHSGIPADVMARCDGALCIPMRGFIPSYNVQAAMAMVAAEALRQQARLAAGE